MADPLRTEAQAPRHRRLGPDLPLVNLRTRCRHTVGLDWTAIGIEHVKVRNVIGHAESLTSPYQRERVPGLRRQTHGDWRHASMRVYRQKLRRLGPCPRN